MYTTTGATEANSSSSWPPAVLQYCHFEHNRYRPKTLVFIEGKIWNCLTDFGSYIYLINCFLSTRRYASAGLCDSNMSVRLSVCLSRASIVSKRRNASWYLHYLVAPRVYLDDAKFHPDILRVSLEREPQTRVEWENSPTHFTPRSRMTLDDLELL